MKNKKYVMRQYFINDEKLLSAVLISFKKYLNNDYYMISRFVILNYKSGRLFMLKIM